jgi:hypothetical protein
MSSEAALAHFFDWARREHKRSRKRRIFRRSDRARPRRQAVHHGEVRTVVVAAASALLLTGCGQSAPPAVSRVELADFSLVAPGLVFELHPTDSPIVVRASARTALKVCPVGTSFAGRWRGGCRELGDQPVSLPATSGAIHVVFRVTTSAGVTGVRLLELRWHCVDRRLGLLRGHATLGHPVFDC